MKIRLASDLTYDSIVDGPGLRTVIWTQGCYHNCRGCHNPQTHDVCGGIEYDIEDIKSKIKNARLQRGITISGGEPFLQAKQLVEIAKFAKARNLDVWIYTGFLLEELLDNNDAKELLYYTDVLVDGKFDIDKTDYQLKYKGSTNQRIIELN